MDEALIERIRQQIAAGVPAQPSPQQPTQAPRQTAPPSEDISPLIARIRQQIAAAGAAQQPAGQDQQQEVPDPTGLDLPTEFPAAQGVAESGPEGVKEVGRAFLGGARDAVQATFDTINAIPGPTGSGQGTSVSGKPKTPGGVPLPTLPEVPRSDESTGGGVALNVVRDLERFVLGFVGGGAVLKGFGVATNTFKGGMAAGALGDFVVTGADDKRLTELFNAVPALQGDVLEAISTDGNENIWKHKLASAAEGMVFGGALEGLFKVVGVIRRSVKAGRESGEEAAAKVLEESGDELQAALKDIKEWNGKAGVMQPAERNGIVAGNDNAGQRISTESEATLAERMDPNRIDTPTIHRDMEEGFFADEGFTSASNANEAAAKPLFEVSPTGQIEMFPEVVRREDAIHDIQLQIKGDRYIDPETGKEKLLPISNRAREELNAAFKDPSSPLHVDKLTPETRDELLRALAADNDAARFFNPKTVRGKPFDLGDARRAEFDAALERSLTVPYDTLKAEAPGTAIEDVLSTFFNYRYMDSADTVKVVLDDMANVMRPMVEKHLGGFPQTFERVGELAGWIGSKPDTLLAIMSQQARAAEYVPAMAVASKAWIQSLTNDIVRINKSIANGTATDTAKIELARRTEILGDLVGTLKAVQTSSARTTAIGRIRTTAEYTHEEIGSLLKEIGEDNFKFVSRALQLTEGNPRAVIALLEPSWGQKFWGVLNEAWINGLLSGFGTNVVNFVGGIRNTLLYPSFRYVGGALTGDKRSMSVALGQYAGLKDALFGSMEMAWRSLKTENAYVDASFHQIEREHLWIKADTFGLSGEDMLGKGIDFLGTAIRMPSRFLTGSDEFLKQLNYRASVKSRAVVEAYERGLKDDVFTNYNVDGTNKALSQVDEYVRDRLNEAFHPRLENGTDTAALLDARTATFTQPLKEATWYNGPTIGEIAQQAAARIPPVRHLVLPFTRVPANIFREMIYESPAAPLRAQFWADIKAGGEARADAVGRLAVGSMFWASAAMLAAEGIITGRGPNDPVLAAQWKLDGKQPYSIKLSGADPDGKDLWIDYSRLGDQWAGMLALAADSAYVMAHVDERTQDQLASTLALSVANNLNSRGYLRSLTELASVIASAGSPQGAEAVQRWLNSRASSYVPRIVQSVNPDDTLRDARSMIDAIYAKVPGLSSTLDAKVDNFGVPIAPQVGWPITEINPFKISLTKPGEARKELAYWSDSPVRAQFEIPSSVIDGVLDLRQAKNDQTGQSAWSRWMEILTEPKFPGGKTFEEHMNSLAGSDGYKELKKLGKEDPIFRRHPAVEFLRAQMGTGYDLAKQMMLQEPGFEELRSALANYDANKQAVPVGGQRIADPTLDELLKKGK